MFWYFPLYLTTCYSQPQPRQTYSVRKRQIYRIKTYELRTGVPCGEGACNIGQSLVSDGGDPAPPVAGTGKSTKQTNISQNWTNYWNVSLGTVHTL